MAVGAGTALYGASYLARRHYRKKVKERRKLFLRMKAARINAYNEHWKAREAELVEIEQKVQLGTATKEDRERRAQLVAEDVEERAEMAKTFSKERARHAEEDRSDPIYYAGKLADKIENPVEGAIAVASGVEGLAEAAKSAGQIAREMSLRVKYKDRYIELARAELRDEALAGVTEAMAATQAKAAEAIRAGRAKAWAAVTNADSIWQAVGAVPAFVGASIRAARAARNAAATVVDAADQAVAAAADADRIAGQVADRLQRLKVPETLCDEMIQRTGTVAAGLVASGLVGMALGAVVTSVAGPFAGRTVAGLSIIGGVKSALRSIDQDKSEHTALLRDIDRKVMGQIAAEDAAKSSVATRSGSA